MADVMMYAGRLQADIYEDLRDNMKEGAALFAHGFNVHFKLIDRAPIWISR